MRRIETRIFATMLLATVVYKMDRYILVLIPFQIQRNPHAVRGGRTPIAVKFYTHGTTTPIKRFW